TSAVLPPAAATPLSGWRTPILYGLAWPNASRQGGGTSMAAPTAPAAAADRLRNRRRVVLPRHHKSLAQGSSCQRSAIDRPPLRVPTRGAMGVPRKVSLSTLTCRTPQEVPAPRHALPRQPGGFERPRDRLALGVTHRCERRTRSEERRVGKECRSRGAPWRLETKR